jgi:hypothetical protein
MSALIDISVINKLLPDEGVWDRVKGAPMPSSKEVQADEVVIILSG